jgi:hypothetical protein
MAKAGPPNEIHREIQKKNMLMPLCYRKLRSPQGTMLPKL